MVLLEEVTAHRLLGIFAQVMLLEFGAVAIGGGVDDLRVGRGRWRSSAFLYRAHASRSTATRKALKPIGSTFF